MSVSGRLLALVFVAALLPACSIKKMAVNRLGDALAGTGSSFASVEDPELDHRVAAHPQHEQVTLAGEVARDREQLFDVFLRQHVGAGGNVAHEWDVTNRATLHDDPRVRVPSDLDRARLGGVTA